MIASDAIAEAFQATGFTHIVWIPDSHLGTWDAALTARYANRLLRVSREGEAIALAAGLMIGQAQPLVVIQCTGFFEAGDALRNVIYDLKLPLKFLIGVRNARNYAAGTSKDSSARFTKPIVEAWQLPYAEFDPFEQTEAAMRDAVQTLAATPTASALLWVE